MTTKEKFLKTQKIERASLGPFVAARRFKNNNKGDSSSLSPTAHQNAPNEAAGSRKVYRNLNV
jgi:hypothetical protein